MTTKILTVVSRHYTNWEQNEETGEVEIYDEDATTDNTIGVYTSLPLVVQAISSFTELFAPDQDAHNGPIESFTVTVVELDANPSSSNKRVWRVTPTLGPRSEIYDQLRELA